MPAPPAFPQLTRSFALSQKEVPLDPTLRDQMENGMETTRARWTRNRRTFTCAIRFITADDKTALDAFYVTTTVYGALPFLLTDPRNAENPQTYTVRFTEKGLPSYSDAGWISGDTEGTAAQYRWHVSLEVREV